MMVTALQMSGRNMIGVRLRNIMKMVKRNIMKEKQEGNIMMKKGNTTKK